MYQRLLLSFRLNKALVCEFARNVTGSREGHQVGQEHYCRHYVIMFLEVKIKLVEFNLVVSSRTDPPVTTNDESYLTVYFVGSNKRCWIRDQ